MGLDISQCDSVEVILKVTERCNINCSYCYMFNKGNEDYRERPSQMSDATIRDIVAFVAQGAQDLSARNVNVVLHGGEPLMLRKERFGRLCESLHQEVGRTAKLQIGLQTNAMLVDEDWIDLFERHGVDVGVSLDGPAHVNDANRKDKRGRGTHSRTVAGIGLLKQAYNDGRIRKPGVVCVMNPDTSAKEVYRHIVSELGFTHMSFNLPMETVDTADPGLEDKLATYLTDLFREWVDDDDPSIRIRLFDQMLRFFSGDAGLRDRLPNYATRNVMVVIAGDGTLSEHDDFKVINFAQRAGTVRDTTLLEFANSPLREYLHHVANTLPDDCRACDWRNYCRAGVTHGVTVSRYSESAGFNNRSSMCAGFSALFEAGAEMLIRNGLPFEVLEQVLEDDPTAPPAASVRRAPAELFS